MVGMGREAWWGTPGPGSQTATRHGTGQRPVIPQGDPGKCPEAASQGGFYLHFV